MPVSSFLNLLAPSRDVEDDEPFAFGPCNPPETGGDPTTEYGLTYLQFKNHRIYFLVEDAASTVETCEVTVAQKTWIDEGFALYAEAQLYCAALTPLTPAQKAQGNYCIHYDTFGATYMYWPHPGTWAECAALVGTVALKWVNIPSNKYTELVQAFSAMDCIQTFLRDFLS